MANKKLTYQTKVMLFGIINMNVEVFTFYDIKTAQDNKDKILNHLRSWVRPLCAVKLIPIYK